MQEVLNGFADPTFWILFSRLRAYRRRKGPEACRKNGFGASKVELEGMLAEGNIVGMWTPAQVCSQRDAFRIIAAECRLCQRCKLGRE